MIIDSTAELISSLLEQLTAELDADGEDLQGDRDVVLFGLREMLLLGLITAECCYGEDQDPTGPLLVSASAIRLTRRGIAFKKQ